MESERLCFRINLDYSHSSRKSRSWLQNVYLLKLLAFNSATVVVTCECECVRWTNQQRPRALRADGKDTALRQELNAKNLQQLRCQHVNRDPNRQQMLPKLY